MGQKATFAGATLLGTHPVSWVQSKGTMPYIAEFDVLPKDIPALLAQGGPDKFHTLTIIDGTAQHTFQKLLLIGIGNAENPHVKRIRVADRRWLWQYKLVRKIYNQRRRVGLLRRGLHGQELQPQPFFEFQYAKFSLKALPDVPWTAEDVIRDILGSEEALGESSGSFFVDPELDQMRELPIENLFIDDRGDLALGRALATIPAADVTVGRDGRIRVYNTLSSTESAITGKGNPLSPGALGPEIVGGGHVEFDDRRFLRPKEVHVYFTIEAELRFDFQEDRVTDAVEGEPPRILDNVLPLPDFGPLTVGAKAERLYQGTWVTIKDAIKAWTDQVGQQGVIKNIDFPLLDRAMVPGNGIWAALDIQGKRELNVAREDWSARFSTLQTHYQTSFRIFPEWMDNILSIRDYLIATIDTVSGQRAPAMAYSNYSYIPSAKGRIKGAVNAGGESFYAFNVFGYPGFGVEIDRTNARPAPARVQIVDSDQGIIHLNYQVDPFRNRDIILPATLVNPPAKNFRKSNNNVPVGFNIKAGNGDVPSLSPEKRVAILVTAVPASPNSKKQLYRVKVTPGELKGEGVLPISADRWLGEGDALGPIKEVHVGAGIETARVRWKDGDSKKIEKIFGVGPKEDPEDSGEDPKDPKGPKGPEEDLKGLVINAGQISDRAASLQSIARAVAASVYAQEHGRVRGSITGRMRGNLQIEGLTDMLIHELGPDGMATTQANLPLDIPALDMFALLPSNSREIILKNVQPFK